MSASGDRTNYQQRAFVSEVTDQGTFLVTVNDWSAATGLSELGNFNTDPDGIKEAIGREAAAYEQDNTGQRGLGAFYTMANRYPGMSNYFFKANGDTKFTPYKNGKDLNNKDIVKPSGWACVIPI